MEAAPGRQKSRSVSIRLLEVVDGIPEGHKIAQLAGVPCAFTPDYAPEEMFKIVNKLYQKSR
jgi:Mn-containing catalase